MDQHSSRVIGGRARTTEIDGFYFNQGPHALCIKDANDSILKEIGWSYTGKIAAGKGYPIKEGKKQEIDSNLGLTGNDGSQFFKSSTNMDFSQLETMSILEWLDKNVHDSNDSEIIKAFIMLNTDGNDPDIQTIGSVLKQIYVGS